MEIDKSEFGDSVYGLPNIGIIWNGNYVF